MNMTIADFLASPYRNLWVREPGIEIYVRKPLPGKPYDIELATFNADVPGSGACSALLDRLEPTMSIYIENVLEPRFAKYFESRGYQCLPNAFGGPPCFVKIKE